MRTGSTTSPSFNSVARSTRTPFTRATTTPRSSAKRSAAVSDTVLPLTRTDASEDETPTARSLSRTANRIASEPRRRSDLPDLHRVETAPDGDGPHLAGVAESERGHALERSDDPG